MKKALIFIYIIISFMSISGCSSNTRVIYNYGDGNGNTYIVSDKTLEYLPIDPAFSSTGFYSGGEYKKITITESDYNEITTLFEKAIADTSNHIENRIKGSGLIQVEKNGKIITSIIVDQSNKPCEIEQLLTSKL